MYENPLVAAGNTANGAADALSRMSDPMPNKALYNLSKLSPLTETWAEELQTAFENPHKATDVFNRWEKYIFLSADQIDPPGSDKRPSHDANESSHPEENIQWRARNNSTRMPSTMPQRSAAFPKLRQPPGINTTQPQGNAIHCPQLSPRYARRPTGVAGVRHNYEM